MCIYIYIYTYTYYRYIYIYIYIKYIVIYSVYVRIYIYISTIISLSLYISFYLPGFPGTASCGVAGQTPTPSPPTKSFDFGGFDSSRLLILKGGNSHVRIILQGVSRKS